MLLSLAFGCGRIGFEVCAGCSSDSGGVQRVQVAAPGSITSMTQTIPVSVTEGDFVIVVAYDITQFGPPSVSDSLGHTWQTLPEESSGSPCSTFIANDLRFWYATIATSGSDTITLGNTFGTQVMGGFVVEYSGIDPVVPVDFASGDFATVAGSALDAGLLSLSQSDHVVAAFAAHDVAPNAITPTSGSVLAHDDNFAAALVDQSVGAGSFTLLAATSNGAPSMCWVGASVALRPR
jgi:hypothetical protein